MAAQGTKKLSLFILGCLVVIIATIVVGVVGVVTGTFDMPSQTPPENESSSDSVNDATFTASDLLESLETKGRAPHTGYDRGEFGDSWVDVDGNGCDTRNDVLQRDLDHVETAGPCKVLTGVLDDPFTGDTINFKRGEETSPLVQIDHLVALSDAWQKGAQQLTFDERVAFANDPLNLLAVDGPTNFAKGNADAATWLPPNREFRCAYVARQISVKAAYGLWVTDAERAAMERVLTDCPDEPALASALMP